MTEKLHVHNLHTQDGLLLVDFGTDVHHRPITMAIERSDHPKLNDTYKELCDQLCVAAQSVMLDIVGSVVPDTPEALVVKYACRICGTVVTSTDEGVVIMDPGRRIAYCANCKDI